MDTRIDDGDDSTFLERNALTVMVSMLALLAALCMLRLPGLLSGTALDLLAALGGGK